MSYNIRTFAENLKSMRKYAELRQDDLFETETTMMSLSALGNPLEKLAEVVDFEMFRTTLEEALYSTKRKNNAGRKPLDPVLVCKVLFLQRFYGLRDDQMEYQITDRTSFRLFLGIRNVADVPDARTIWKYRDILSDKGVFDKLFDEFHDLLDSKGLIFNEGKIIDASFVVAPRQRNTKEENEQIKDGKGDELWNDKPHKKCHKDIDARWTKKREETIYGYKDHTKADEKSKLIDTYSVTDASVHDSQVIKPLIRETDKGQKLRLDAGYVGQEAIVIECGMEPVICEKGVRGKPLTEEQKESNRQKSKTRCRIEHIFGFMEGAMHGLFTRSIGLTRAKAYVALTSLVYNICRYKQILEYHPDWVKCVRLSNTND